MWNKYYKLPFRLIDNKILDNDCHMVADFINKWMNIENSLSITEENQQIVLDIINGKQIPSNKFNFTYNSESGLISLNNRPLLLIRGWGYLTGNGGCNLNSETAIEIQNSLVKYIINQLSYDFQIITKINKK